MEWVQQEAGTEQGFLQDTRTGAKYVNNGLIPQIRRSLQKSKCTIWTKEEEIKIRQEDSYIMDHVINNYPNAQVKIINNWRLYLQVEKISDIATADGRQIHEGWYQRYGHRNSTSSLKWPKQMPPANRYWPTWISVLNRLADEHRKLRTRITEWNVHIPQHE